MTRNIVDCYPFTVTKEGLGKLFIRLANRLLTSMVIDSWVNAGKQIVRASTDGLIKILQGAQELLYDFGWTYASRKHAQWLFYIHNNHQDQKTCVT